MTALAIIAGSLIVWLSVSSTAAVLIGRGIRLADSHETPPVRADAAAHRRAHLWSVR